MTTSFERCRRKVWSYGVTATSAAVASGIIISLVMVLP